MEMAGMGRRDYLRAIHARYQRGTPQMKGSILDEFCSICGLRLQPQVRHPTSGKATPPKVGQSHGGTAVRATADRWSRC